MVETAYEDIKLTLSEKLLHPFMAFVLMYVEAKGGRREEEKGMVYV